MAAPQDSTAVYASAGRLGKLAIPLDRPELVLAELAAGHAVVIGQAEHADGIAAGYDVDSNRLSLYAPPGGVRELSLAGWANGWRQAQRWAVLLLGPGELPVRPDPASYVRAAASLEQAGSPWEAVLAYDAGVAQWPDNPRVRAGLAQCLYKLGAVREAVVSLAEAISLTGDATERQRILHLADDLQGHRTAMPTPAGGP